MLMSALAIRIVTGIVGFLLDFSLDYVVCAIFGE